MTKVIPNIKLFLILIFFSLLIFFLDTIKLLDLPKRVLFYVTNPVSFGIYNTNRNIGKQFHFIFQARFASQENKALKEQIGKLLSENAELRKQLAETVAFLSQEKHLDPNTYNLLPARPIGLGRHLKIDKGSSSNLKAGQAVIFEDNFIGKIVSVTHNASNIELLTDPNSKVAVFSQNKDGRAKGVLLGQFGTEILMDKILHEEKIAEGDLVYSEGLEGFLPRGLILGRVTKILERETEVFKQAKVQPIFDIRDLELVFIIQE
ncbi:MAG: rod shape-determining protein MreC [Candidatus Daviesbacteria bacterium]|nr:rod shape-determining protein MreC [Candidatus Daviesbacteria bacterium]